MSTVELPIGGLTELLREIVEINSVSDNLVGIRRIAERIAAELTALGFDVKLHAGEHRRQRVDRDLEGAAPLEPDDGSERGLHLVGRLDGDPGSTTVLLLGHMDTVYAQSSPFQALQVDGDLACGPGVVDMKGGLVVILGGLRALIESGAPRPSLLIVFNSDEEVSSNTSRGLIEELIASHRPDFCFCVEPGERRADGTEELVVERKGHCCLHVV